MTGRPLGEPSLATGVLPCSNQVEKGVFFGKGGGYVKVCEFKKTENNFKKI